MFTFTYITQLVRNMEFLLEENGARSSRVMVTAHYISSYITANDSNNLNCSLYILTAIVFFFLRVLEQLTFRKVFQMKAFKTFNIGKILTKIYKRRNLVEVNKQKKSAFISTETENRKTKE